MSFIQNFFTSRDNNANTETYVGQVDRLWYNPDTNSIRVSDGNTPGGLPVDYSTNANVSLNTFTANTGTINGNLIVVGNISPAAAGKIGGIQPGPGVEISNTGLLTIDSANLPLSFGNFFANNNILSIVNMDEDMILATQGNANVEVRGAFNIVTTTDSGNTVFRVNDEGDITATTLNITNSSDLALQAPLNVSINQDGLTKFPAVISGAVAQFTGRDDIQPALVVDAYGYDAALAQTGGKLVYRTGRGTNANTTPVLSGDRLGVVAAAGWASNGYAGTDSVSLVMSATEDFTPTTRGGKLDIRVVPTGTATTTTIATVDGNGITMASSKTITATANITTTNTFVGNLSGLVTHGFRNAGSVGGTTLTLDVATDDVVHCTFTDNFTVNFTNIIPGRIVTLLATNTSGGDTDIITSGISAVNMQGDNTLTVTEQTTAVITYYSTGTTTGNIYASAVYN